MASRLYSRQFFKNGSSPPDFDFGGNFTSRTEEVGHLRDLTVQIAGSFTADVTVEGAVGTGPFTPLAAAITSAGWLAIPETVERIRIVTTSHSGGTVNAWVAGSERRIGQ